MRPEFVAFPKIPRLRRAIFVTEKIDGTNGVVHVDEDGTVSAGSRTRWITPEDDNFGFARWVRDHADELKGLGIGTHHGEWWGQGIQRKYGLTEKRFSLFNVSAWTAETPPPACCHVVPVLATDDAFDMGAVHNCLEMLRMDGGVAAPGFLKPEGVCVYHVAAGCYFKVTIERDSEPKSMVGPR